MNHDDMRALIENPARHHAAKNGRGVMHPTLALILAAAAFLAVGALASLIL